MSHESITNGNDKALDVAAAPPVKRMRASGPILILAVLFVLGAFLSWYFSWFGRDLSDADIANYLVDQNKPRHVQHALLQVQQRIERGDGSASKWYPQVIQLASSPEREFRLTAAWLMGFDNRSTEFHQTLLKLVADPEPIVRRNAALALVRFNDKTGRTELRAILEPYQLPSPANGVIASSLKEGAQLARGTLVVRLNQSDGMPVEVRSPLPGSLAQVLTPTGTAVSAGTPMLTINSDENSIWEALRGLALVGDVEDLPAVDVFVKGGSASAQIQQQASRTAKAIQGRANAPNENVKP